MHVDRRTDGRTANWTYRTMMKQTRDNNCPLNRAASWQNQQNGMCAQRRLRSAWVSASLLSAWRKLGSLATHWAPSEDSDQTGWMTRLIWVFAGRRVILLVLSWGGCYSFHSFCFKLGVVTVSTCLMLWDMGSAYSICLAFSYSIYKSWHVFFSFSTYLHFGR